MADKILESFMHQQRIDGNALAAASDILDLHPLEGSPTQRYVAVFHAKGLVKSNGEITEANQFDVGIWLPKDYLRHANVGQILTYLGPHANPWHPNIHAQGGAICIHINPGTPLVDLLYNCYELWTWTLYATRDEGLNHAASQWARRQDPERFPIDARPLKRRDLRLTIQTVDKANEATGTPS